MDRKNEKNHDATLASAIIKAMWISGLITAQERNAITVHCEKALNAAK